MGIFHETYRVSAGQWETIYGAMPEIGLLAAGRAVTLDAASTSAIRLGARAEDTAPVTVP